MSLLTAAEPRLCPSCGAELVARRTGRPPTYCSKACRQAAHRARGRAEGAADHATWLRARMVWDLDEALQALSEARALLADGPVREHPHRMAAALAAAGGEDWHAGPPTGWEPPVQELVAAAGRQVHRVESYVREHARAAAEHEQAMRIAGIRRAPAPVLEGDETPAGNVAAAEAEALATKPGDGEGGEVDRDEAFDAVEDLLMAVDATTPAGNELPAALGDAVAAPAGRLAEAWSEQDGAGPLDELAAAALAVVAAARPYEEAWPLPLSAAVVAVETAFGPK